MRIRTRIERQQQQQNKKEERRVEPKRGWNKIDKCVYISSMYKRRCWNVLITDICSASRHRRHAQTRTHTQARDKGIGISISRSVCPVHQSPPSPSPPSPSPPPAFHKIGCRNDDEAPTNNHQMNRDSRTNEQKITKQNKTE